MKLTVEIELDNAAFKKDENVPDKAAIACFINNSVVSTMVDAVYCATDIKLRDVNGNTVGYVRLT